MNVYETADGQANTCRHDSATGVDTTSPSDPDKVWRCDHCGLTWTSDGALADRVEALVREVWPELGHGIHPALTASTIPQRLLRAIGRDGAA